MVGWHRTRRWRSRRRHGGLSELDGVDLPDRLTSDLERVEWGRTGRAYRGLASGRTATADRPGGEISSLISPIMRYIAEADGIWVRAKTRRGV